MEKYKISNWYCTYSMKCKVHCPCYRGNAYTTTSPWTPFCHSKPKNHKLVNDFFLYKMEVALRNGK